jgi:hypothetical protein
MVTVTVLKQFLFCFCFGSPMLFRVLSTLSTVRFVPSIHSSVWYSLFTGHRLCFLIKYSSLEKNSNGHREWSQSRSRSQYLYSITTSQIPVHTNRRPQALSALIYSTFLHAHVHKHTLYIGTQTLVQNSSLTYNPQ